MTQHDGNIADQLAPAFRTDLNNALVALLTNSSGATAPSSTYAHMLWVDTTTDMVKIRSAADDAWISLFSLDESGNLATPAGLSIASQAEAEAGTENTKTMTALRVAQAIAALASGDAGFDPSATWQNVSGSRSLGTSYQNTTGYSIMLNISASRSSGGGIFQVSDDNSTWINVGLFNNEHIRNFSIIVPDDWYFRASITGSLSYWAELRS